MSEGKDHKPCSVIGHLAQYLDILLVTWIHKTCCTGLVKMQLSVTKRAEPYICHYNTTVLPGGDLGFGVTQIKSHLVTYTWLADVIASVV